MKKRVMVVDDSRVMELQICKLLEGSKFEVVAYCENGEEAISRYEEIQPDIVTMDIIMPGIDGLEAAFSGDLPTLIIRNADKPGQVAEVAGALSRRNVNIATMQLYRDKRGGSAVLVLECDKEVPRESIKWLEKLEGIYKVTYLSLEEAKKESS